MQVVHEVDLAHPTAVHSPSYATPFAMLVGSAMIAARTILSGANNNDGGYDRLFFCPSVIISFKQREKMYINKTPLSVLHFCI